MRTIIVIAILTLTTILHSPAHSQNNCYPIETAETYFHSHGPVLEVSFSNKPAGYSSTIVKSWLIDHTKILIWWKSEPPANEACIIISRGENFQDKISIYLSSTSEIAQWKSAIREAQRGYDKYLRSNPNALKPRNPIPKYKGLNGLK